MHVLFYVFKENLKRITHGNPVIGSAVSWARLDFKMILHHVRYDRRVGHD